MMCGYRDEYLEAEAENVRLRERVVLLGQLLHRCRVLSDHLKLQGRVTYTPAEEQFLREVDALLGDALAADA